ncbi:2Fe-2S iron-sulfur cluster-binding protein [Devosia enhydra]|uniref:2Fe-2S iron-sulfur cluster-binding protein n=1 Tax=Devosia enhydra TaxID=665118 RepID=UPI003CC7C923
MLLNVDGTVPDYRFRAISMSARVARAGKSTANASSCAGTPWDAGHSHREHQSWRRRAVHITLSINGKDHELDLDPRTSVLDALRDHLDLIGTKKGCDHGQCGACTVLVNGRRINSCLTLAVMHEGDAITTIEGLGTPEALSPLQAAFVAHDGFQCGYCTPGQICSATGMLEEMRAGWPSHVSEDLLAAPDLSDAEISERMSGNLCRCSAYTNIVAAITEVAEARDEAV